MINTSKKRTDTTLAPGLLSTGASNANANKTVTKQ